MLGFEVTHLYGLTETFGPIMICEPQLGWADVDPEASSDFIELDYDEAVAALSPEEREALELLEHLANLEEGEQR